MYSYKLIDPSEYHVLHPRPAYLIVSRSSSGRLNVMAASWVSPVSEEPPLIIVAIERGSLTREYILETKEFTINVVGEEHLNLTYRAGTVSGRSVDKWKMLGLEEESSKYISVPGIKGSYGFIECVLSKVVEAGECDLLFCEPKAIHVREDLYTRYGWDLRKARILMHVRGRAFTVPGRLLFAGKK
ncbi:MAG: flavin reductase family protein [Staphylothermus sp.]|nr:flavin reductase family protein [Staphylothermus sp.]